MTSPRLLLGSLALAAAVLTTSTGAAASRSARGRAADRPRQQDAPRTNARLERLVEGAVQQAAEPGDQLEVRSTQLWANQACVIESARVQAPVRQSGRVGVRLVGQRRQTPAAKARGLRPVKGREQAKARPCTGFAWVDVRLQRQVLVTTRAVSRGDVVGEHLAIALREVPAGRAPLTAVDARAVVTRDLKAGAMLESFMIRRQGAKAGAAVPVHIVTGPIRVVLTGTAVRCSRRQACARLPSGQLVRGRPDGDAVIVEGGLP